MLPRLKKLAIKSASFESFLSDARQWVKWYGFPGNGSLDDYKTFYNAIKRGK